jgi:hypothetical protein
MVSGYCKCGFPASLKCPACGVKICGNCYPSHVAECRGPMADKAPGPVEVKPAAVVEEKDEPAPVNNYQRKPGRPRVKK